jgi:hypothetical protein
MAMTEQQPIRHTPDIPQRLTDALREQWFIVDTPEDLADVLLSLPGIAIIELPEPDSDGDKRLWRFLDHGEYEHVIWPSHLYPEDDISISGIGGYNISEARALAAALLAAANAAEADQ